MKLAYVLAGVLALSKIVAAQTPVLPASGCPMAHCNAHLNDAVREITPAVGDVVASDQQSVGSNNGLGCSSNGSVAACTFTTKTGSNLIAYDADGNRIFSAAPGLPNYNAAKSAPIVFTNGMVLIADNRNVILFHADGTTQWITPKPDLNPAISPVLVGPDIVLVATAIKGTVTTYDLATGQLLGSFYISDPTCGNYSTANTPAVNGSRAYIVSACIADQTKGGLAAIDVVTTGPARGSMTQAWLYSFPGPSGASPLYNDGVIFFDGVYSPGSPFGTFMGVQDTTNGPVQLWQANFSKHFAANAGQDPRGGIWVFPLGSPYLYRLNNKNGAILQRLPVPIPAGQTGPYAPSSAVSLSKAANGGAVLTFGAVSVQSSEPGTVAAVDVVNGAVLWQTAVPGPQGNSTAAQFPIVVNAAGLSRVVFPGSLGGTYFIGKPAQ